MSQSSQLARRVDLDGPPTEVRVARVTLSIGSLDALRATALRQVFPPHTHDTFAIGVIEGGANRLRYRGANHIASAGSIVAIPPGEVHTGEPIDELGWSYRMFYPDRELMRIATEGALDGDGVSMSSPVVRDDGELAHALGSVHRSLVERACSLDVEERLVTALSVLVARHTNSRHATPPRTGRAAMRVRLALEYLNDHFAEPVRLAELSTACGVTPCHLIRLFRRSVGVSPHAYLKQLRVNRARAMLVLGASVAAASCACGFSDQAHLTRTFKSLLGVPPGAYRRAVRRSEGREPRGQEWRHD